MVSRAEIDRSRLFIVYLHQTIYFSTLRDRLKSKNKLSTPLDSAFAKLNLWLDGDLMRVGGRLENAELPHDNKYPLLLQHKDVFTRLLIRQVHLLTAHGGTRLTLATLRLVYWIVKERNAVKAELRRCVNLP